MDQRPISLKILLVEDNHAVRDVTVELILELGHQVVAVSDAESALVCLDEQSFNALMTDIRLPGKSGLALAAEVALRFSKLPIIIASGYGNFNEEIFKPEHRLRVIVLPKPYEFEILKQALDQITELIAMPEAGAKNCL